MTGEVHVQIKDHLTRVNELLQKAHEEGLRVDLQLCNVPAIDTDYKVTYQNEESPPPSAMPAITSYTLIQFSIWKEI